MEQIMNSPAPEARDPGDPLGFEPVPLRYRCDGWTPARQVAFVEALADCGVIREAAARVGMSEKSVSHLRRRRDGRAFDIACEAAQRIGARGLLSIAYDRAINGTPRARYYHGERVGEERVYDNRLLTYLIGKTGSLLEPRPESVAVEADWDRSMESLERGTPPPEAEESGSAAAPPDEVPYTGTELWEEDDVIWTSYPPPDDFDGEEDGEWGDEDYCRTLSEAEEAVVRSDGKRARAARIARARAERDSYFGFAGNENSSSTEAEPSTPSEPSEAAEEDFTRRREGAGGALSL
jgi:hypothetical protein